MYGCVCVHKHTHMHTHMPTCTHMHVRTHTLTLSTLVELSSSGFEARELSWADTPFLTYVLSLEYFMAATGKEGNDNTQ